MAGATLKGDLTKRMRRGERRVATAVRQTAKAIEKGAKQRVAVDTGYLKSQIRSEPLDEHQALVVADTDYAKFLEYGTRRMAAQPYFIPAVEAERKQFVRKIRKAYD